MQNTDSIPPIDEARLSTRYVVRLDRSVMLMVAALEIPTMVMVMSILLATGGPWWVALIIFACLVAGVVAIGALRVVTRLEERRLCVGMPPFYWKSVPYDDIADAKPITARAMRDAGGWGPKWRSGATWILMRSGPAVRVTRRSGKRPIVFSVPDARAAAIAILERVVHERR